MTALFVRCGHSSISQWSEGDLTESSLITWSQTIFFPSLCGWTLVWWDHSHNPGPGSLKLCFHLHFLPVRAGCVAHGECLGSSWVLSEHRPLGGTCWVFWTSSHLWKPESLIPSNISFPRFLSSALWGVIYFLQLITLFPGNNGFIWQTLCVAASRPWRSFKLWEIRPSPWYGYLQSYCTDNHTSQRMGPTVSLQNQGPHWDPVHQAVVTFVLMKHSLGCCKPLTIFHSSDKTDSGSFASLFSVSVEVRRLLEFPISSILWHHS